MTFLEKLGRLAPWNRADANVETRPEPALSRPSGQSGNPSGAPLPRKPAGELFPRFRANANDHVSPQAVDAQARARMKLLEAFTPSQPVGDRKRFAGRTEILTQLIRAIEEQITKRAQAADAEANKSVGDAAVLVANVDKSAPKKEEKKLDLGTIALIGTAIGGISALLGGFLTALFGLGMWMPVGFLGIVLLISGPSMLLAYLKLHQIGSMTTYLGNFVVVRPDERVVPAAVFAFAHIPT